MIKLLNIKTGNIFTLPDQEALAIKANDRANEFKVLEAGLTEEVEEQVTPEEAEALANAPIEKLDDTVPDDAVAEVKPTLPHTHEKEYLEMEIDLEKATPVELRGYCGRLGIKVGSTASKKSMIAKIKETGIVK
jgi:hypothetical protein